jgi:hypothetical protein
MDIAGTVSELTAIITEEKNMRTRMRTLRERRLFLENNVCKFLEETDDSGIKYKDIELVIEDKLVRTRLKAREKEDFVLAVLQKAGVANPVAVLPQVIEATKGEARTKTKLAVRKSKS